MGKTQWTLRRTLDLAAAFGVIVPLLYLCLMVYLIANPQNKAIGYLMTSLFFVCPSCFDFVYIGIRAFGIVIAVAVLKSVILCMTTGYLLWVGIYERRYILYLLIAVYLGYFGWVFKSVWYFIWVVDKAG